MPVAHDWVSRHAYDRPTSAALSSHDTDFIVTWGQLEERVAALAYTLRTRYRIRHGDRVAVIAENDPRVFELQFAVWRVGAIFVPLNWRLAPEELRVLCGDAEPRLIVHDDAWADAAGALVDAGSDIGRLSWGASPGHADPYEQACLSADGVEADSSCSTDDIAQLLFTSGTTGLPKGALITRGALVTQAINLAHRSRVAEAGCHYYDPLPLFHAGGLNVVATPILYWGGHVSTEARLIPSKLVATLGNPKHNITHFAIIPILAQSMADDPAFATADFSTLRCVIVGAGIVTSDLARRWLDAGAPLQSSYGGTEMGPTGFSLELHEHALLLKGSVGRPAFHTEVRLVDDTGADVLDGCTGEILLRGASVAVGYWRRPRSECFTGRLVSNWRCGPTRARWNLLHRWAAEGHVQIRGENVYPAEAERVLVSAPGVAEVIVLGVPDPKWSEVGLAVVVPKSGSTVTLEALRAFGNEKLAKFKLPQRLVVVDELPKNSTGKVSRNDLAARYGNLVDAGQHEGISRPLHPQLGRQAGPSGDATC